MNPRFPARLSPRSHPSAAAFSLVELICAIALLAFSLAGLVQGITVALASSRESGIQTSAALVAAGRIELLRADRLLVDGTREGQCDEPLSAFAWRESISPTTVPGLHEITLQVSHGRTDDPVFELKTLLFDPPPDTSNRSQERQRDRRERNQGERRGR